MSKRQVGLVVGKDFRPPEGASPFDWCFLTIEVEEERVAVRVTREQADHADIGDMVRFRRPKSAKHHVGRLVRLYSAPARVPPPVWSQPGSVSGRHTAQESPPEEGGHHETEQETADMGFPGHVGAAQSELSHEPERQEHEGRHRK